jgi:tRNA threonylcarbamoyl adenosine modification protein YeaZ
MKILALEFSSPQRSVAALAGDARGHVRAAAEVVESAPGRVMKPFAMITSALQQAGWEREQIECIAVGLGPGSYNGIRVAIALAQGWQLATGVKLLGVSSAEGVAAQAWTEGVTGRVSVVIDAQRGEFYLAGYALGAGGWRAIAPLCLTTPDAVRERQRAGDTVVGPELDRWFPGGRVVFPRAGTLGRLALGRNDFLPGEKLEPIYLRQTSFVKAPPPRVI